MVRGDIKNASLVRCAIAATLFNFSMFSLTYSVYPIFNVLNTSVRYLTTFVGATALVLVVVAAFRAPRLLDFRMIEIVVVTGLAGGGFCCLLGLQTGNIVLMGAGACCSMLARDIVDVLLGLAIADLPKKQIIPCITLSFFLAWLLQLLFSSLPSEIVMGLFVVLPLLPFLLISRQMSLLFPKLQKATAPAEVSATRPTVFLSFAHQLFICTFLFMFSWGCAVGLGEGEGGLPQTLNLVASLPVLGIIAIMAILLPKHFDIDKAFMMSAFLVIAGFIFVPIGDVVFPGFANMLLSAGSNAFRVLVWCAFALIAHRNKQNGIIAFSWGRALIAFGIVLGTFFGRTYNDFVSHNETMLALSSAVIALLFVGYILFALKKFSFSQTIRSIETPSSEQHAANAGLTVEAKCARLGALYALTPREIDVLVLVAKGRNAPFIEEKLVISRNTVKSHVKHIYGKLGVHSNQELIDLVESIDE